MLLALLQEAGIETVVDVRSFPRSRRNPQFDAETLAETLAQAGIGYRHLKALGGRRGRPKDGGESPNGLWREEGFRNYADYALTEEFRSGLSELRTLAAERTCAVMCTEAVWWRCHRRIITDYLIAGGVPVRHILGPGQTESASMTAGAEVRDDGSVIYPPTQPSLL